MDAPGVLPLAGLDLMFNSDSGENKRKAVVETWQRLVQGLLGALALAGAVALALYYAPPESSGNSGNSDQALEQQVHQLSRQVADLERADLEHDQSFSPIAVDNARESVAYIYGIYHLSSRTHGFRARVSGTGFVVAPGLLATNRHVAEPWYGDREVELECARAERPYWKN